MIKGIEAILISSANPQKLAEFYREAVGLKLTLEAEMGEKGEKIFSFDMKGSANLYIIHHSKVKGKNKDKSRIMFNLEVDNIEKEVKRLGKSKAKKIQDIYHVEDFGYVATFEDPDGNYFQLVKTRE